MVYLVYGNGKLAVTLWLSILLVVWRASDLVSIVCCKFLSGIKHTCREQWQKYRH
ncbi:MAG: hypothetical protein LBQ66_08725 [Planctomycetaceae bacterium]|nr:hypothetical protein [Planctomycetaceae bacterium]